MIESLVPNEFTDLASAQAEHEPELFGKPNVVGVALGTRHTGGADTGERAIAALVETKMAEHMLRPDDVLPRSAGGYPVDVQEVGTLQAGDAMPAADASEHVGRSIAARAPAGPQALTRRERPAFGGLSIGHFKITAGTLGTCCYDAESFPGKPSRYYVLSNNHVLANSNDAAIGDPILQPGPVDGGALESDVIAHLSRFVPIKFSEQGQQAPLNYVDAAIGEGAFPDLDRRIYWIGHLDGVESTPRPDDLVRKCGRTTNFTTGQVRNVNATVNVNYGGGRVGRFARQIVTSGMSEGGDSGSLVVARDQRAVGLLFAGSSKVTIANPITLVQELLGVRITEGGPVG